MFQLLDFLFNIFTFVFPFILTVKILDSTITFKYSSYQFIINYWLYFVIFQYLQYNLFVNNLVFNYVTKAIKFWLFYGHTNNLRLLNDFLIVRFINLDMVQLFEVNYINPVLNKINPNFREINYQIYLSGKIYLRPFNYNIQFKFLNDLFNMFQAPPQAPAPQQQQSSRHSSSVSKVIKKLRKPKRVNSGDSAHSDNRARSGSRSSSNGSNQQPGSRSRRNSSPSGGDRDRDRDRTGSRSIYSSGSSNRSSNPTSPNLSPVDYQTVADQIPPVLLSIPKYKRPISPPPYEEIIPDIVFSETSTSSRSGSRSVSRRGSFSSVITRPTSSGSGNNNNHETIDSTLMTTNNGNSADVRISSGSMNRIQELLNNANSRNNDLPPMPTPGMMNNR